MPIRFAGDRKPTFAERGSNGHPSHRHGGFHPSTHSPSCPALIERSSRGGPLHEPVPPADRGQTGTGISACERARRLHKCRNNGRITGEPLFRVLRNRSARCTASGVVNTVVIRAKCAMVSASPSNCQLSRAVTSTGTHHRRKGAEVAPAQQQLFGAFHLEQGWYSRRCRLWCSRDRSSPERSRYDGRQTVVQAPVDVLISRPHHHRVLLAAGITCAHEEQGSPPSLPVSSSAS